MDEMVKIVAGWNDLNGGGTVTLFGEVNLCAVIEQLPVGIGEEYNDGRCCASKLAFLYNGKSKRGLEYRAFRIKCDVVEEQFQ